MEAVKVHGTTKRDKLHLGRGRFVFTRNENRHKCYSLLQMLAEKKVSKSRQNEYRKDIFPIRNDALF